MKKILYLIFAIAFVFTGCKSQEINNDKPQIYASFYAIYDFASEIAGDRADVYNMVPTGTEPHDWEPTAQDMAKLANADVLFYNGLGMESWIDKVKVALGESNIIYCRLSDNIEDENATDPHIWLDPNNVIKMAETIKNTLCDIDSENAQYYNENYESYVKELEALDENYRSEINKISEDNRNLVVSHEAYSYLCNAYNLTQISIEGINADSEPSPARVAELIDYIKANNIKYIFYEELASPEAAKTISRETGCTMLSLNPFEGLTEEQISNGDNYIYVMKENLQNIKIALGDN